MMNARHLSTLLTCAIALPLGTSCGEDADSLSGNEASVEKASCDEAPAPDAGAGVRIIGIKSSGSGCPAGSLKTTLLPNGSGYDVSFEHYALSAGPDKPSLQTLACNVSLEVQAPSGASYALSSFEHVGDAQLEPGTKAEFISNFAFTGLGAIAGREIKADVPSGGPFTIMGKPEDLQWSPCNMTSRLQLRTRLVLTSDGSASGHVRISKLGRLRFDTRACDAPPDSVDGGVDGGVTPDGSMPIDPVSTMDGGQSQPPAPPAASLPVVRVTTSGSNCSGQTARSAIAPDGRSFTVSFDDLAVSNKATDTNAYCRVALDVAGPEGKSYALEGFSVQGSAELAEGVSARILSVTDFTGAGVDLSKETTTTIAGPLSGPVSLDETFSPQQLNFSRCGASPGSLGLRFRVVLQGPPERASRFSVAQLRSFRFVQRDCP